jgi:hypothetical protein
LDYFQHVDAHSHWSSWIYWEQGSLPIEKTIWQQKAGRRRAAYDPSQADVVFLAGTDWQANLIQHVRHADPESNVFPFLAERAIRICVSAEVEAAILATGRVNGPTFTIPNGIDQSHLIQRLQRDCDVFVLGTKQPRLAQALADTLREQGMSVTAITELSPHDEVLAGMARSRVSVVLPNATEGFYLPALESMALSGVTVVPDCIGNRSFCHHGENCLMPALDLASLAAAALQALEIARSARGASFQRAAEATLARHTLARERSDFYAILDNIDTIWQA